METPFAWTAKWLGEHLPVDLYFPVVRVQARQLEYYRERMGDRQIKQIADFYRKIVVDEKVRPWTPGDAGNAIARRLMALTGYPALTVLKWLVPVYDLAKEGKIEAHWIDPSNGDTSLVQDIIDKGAEIGNVALGAFKWLPLVVVALGAFYIWTKRPARAAAVPPAAGTRTNPGRSTGGRDGLSKYRAFHGRAPRRRLNTTREFPDTGDDLIQLGDAKSIVYACDKLHGGGDGKFAEYEHKFSRGTRLYTDAPGQTLYVFGPKMKVQEPGIIG